MFLYKQLLWFNFFKTTPKTSLIFKAYCGFNYFCGCQFLLMKQTLHVCGYLILWFCWNLHTSLMVLGDLYFIIGQSFWLYISNKMNIYLQTITIDVMWYRNLFWAFIYWLWLCSALITNHGFVTSNMLTWP